MKEGDLVTGKVTGFTYVGTEVSYCRVSVTDDKGHVHRGIIGKAENFAFPHMMALRGADAPVNMEFSGVIERNGVKYGQYVNVEFCV